MNQWQLKTKHISFMLLHYFLQHRAKQTAHLVNKHYENEVTLTGQIPPLKYCRTLEILTNLTTGLDLSML